MKLLLLRLIHAASLSISSADISFFLSFLPFSFGKLKMGGRGGCCIARYGGAAYDTSKLDRIMLRFRPIAPKPTASGGESKAADGGASSNGYVKARRGRRRRSLSKDDNNKHPNNSNGGRKRKSGSPEENGETLSGRGELHDSTVVTLSLLPETPDLTADTRQGQKLPVWRGKEEECYGCLAATSGGSDRQVGLLARGQRAVVWSSVIVECVTDTWVEEAGLGRTDEERRKMLEEDTSPGFISDGWNRVWWTNRAFRELAGKTASFECREEEEVVVCVVMREKVPVTCKAYTCRVRMQSTRKGRENSSGLLSASSSVTLPCDVWRMSSGGFAWRLDVKAALSLGR